MWERELSYANSPLTLPSDQTYRPIRPNPRNTRGRWDRGIGCRAVNILLLEISPSRVGPGGSIPTATQFANLLWGKSTSFFVCVVQQKEVNRCGRSWPCPHASENESRRISPLGARRSINSALKLSPHGLLLKSHSRHSFQTAAFVPRISTTNGTSLRRPMQESDAQPNTPAGARAP